MSQLYYLLLISVWYMSKKIAIIKFSKLLYAISEYTSSLYYYTV